MLVINLLMNISNSTSPDALNSSRRNHESRYNPCIRDYDYGNIIALIGTGYQDKYCAKQMSFSKMKYVLISGIRHLFTTADEYSFLRVYMALPVSLVFVIYWNFFRKLNNAILIISRLQDYFRRLSIASLTSNFLRKREYTRRMTYRIVIRYQCLNTPRLCSIKKNRLLILN